MKASYIKKSLLKTINSMSRDIELFVKRPGMDFSRNRKCSFHSILTCILSMESHSLNREIRKFFNSIKAPIPTKSAFIQQRDKFNDYVFPYLFSSFNDSAPFKKTYQGYHLLACDGSDINIPPLNGAVDTYVHSNTKDVGYHQMHLNAMYDLLEERYSDIIIQPRAIYNEREAFLDFIDRNPISGKCVYIADAGYFSLNVLAHLLISGQSFVLKMRTPDSQSAFLKRFTLPDSDELDVRISFCVTRSKKKSYMENPDKYIYIKYDRRFDPIAPSDTDSLFRISIRLVKIMLPDGKSEYLITNLPENKFSLDSLKKLYRMRWGIETSFRYLKYNVALNYFHSIRRDFILQEMYARVILYNFTMLIVHSVSPPESKGKLQYKVSVSDAIVTCRDYLIHRFKNAEIERFILFYLTDVRLGRSSPRKTRSKRFVPLNNRV